MDDEGTYRFVAHVKDAHGQHYRNGQDRWALDLNGKANLKSIWIEDDWMVTPNGTALNPIARHPKFKEAFRQAGILVKYLGWDCCRSIGYQPFITFLSQFGLHNQTFDSDKDNTIHLMGVSYWFPYDDKCGFTWDIGCWWASVFVEKIRDMGYSDESILLTTVHEAGHAVGLVGDHSPNDPSSYTENPRPGYPGQYLECVMCQGGPALASYRDYRFCRSCRDALKQLSNQWHQ